MNDAIISKACIAINSFAHRAVVEARRINERLRISQHETFKSQDSSIALDENPVPWMIQDGSDIKVLGQIIRSHPLNPRVCLDGATAICSLIECSTTHANAAIKYAWSELLKMAESGVLFEEDIMRIEPLTILEQVSYQIPKTTNTNFFRLVNETATQFCSKK